MRDAGASALTAKTVAIPGAGLRRSPNFIESATSSYGGNQRSRRRGLFTPSLRYKPPAMGGDLDPELFREVFGRFATGVAVITSAGPTGAGGMTANALCSLSLDPLLALVCFENRARTLPIVREAARFAVNLLASDQERIAAVFASKLPEAEKVENVKHRFEHGVPIIEGALAWAACDLRELIAGGDHTIGIGQVIAMGLGDGSPLLWYAGRYHAPGLDAT
jgi:flavin reductase (DIM6/NTAB) family NADH-FMN oxidoreductase RutF